jgi:hypothetical protein
VGELFVPSSDVLRRWPFDALVLGIVRALVVVLESPFVCDAFSSSIVSTDTGFPALDFHFPVPEFLSVRGGLGGALLAVAEGLEEGSLSFEAFKSVAGGVKGFTRLGRWLSPRDSRACSLDKDGYGRLDFDSDLREPSSIFPGIEERLFSSTGEMDVLEDVFSLVETLRLDRCLSRSLSLSLSLSRSLSLSLSLSLVLSRSRSRSLLSLSVRDDSFFSRRRSALLSRTLEGMITDGKVHVAAADGYCPRRLDRGCHLRPRPVNCGVTRRLMGRTINTHVTAAAVAGTVKV